MQNQTNNQNLNISLADSDEVKCENCNWGIFNQVFFVRKISKFKIGTHEDAIVNIPAFKCDNCGHINKEFLPPVDKK